MVIKIFLLHCCTVVLSSCSVYCSAQSECNYSMPSAQPSIHPEMILISKKKFNTCNFSRDFEIGPHAGPENVVNLLHVKIF